MKKSVVELTRELIKIPSENGIQGEDNVLEYILSLIKGKYDCKIYKRQVSEGRTNAMIVFEPSSKAKLLLFSGHMDTVPGYEENNTDNPIIKDGKLFGRGTSDMKGADACFLKAVLDLIEEHGIDGLGDEKGLAIALTVDEETGCTGIRYLDTPSMQQVLKRCKICILGEPTNIWPVYGHKGIVWYDVEITGTACHASVPHLGENAIYKASNFIEKIQDYARELKSIDSPIGSPSINVGTINGGEATNIVPNRCKISVDRRFVSGEDPEHDKKHILHFLKSVDPKAKLKSHNVGYPYLLPNGQNNLYFKMVSNICLESNITRNRCILEGYTEADLYYRKYKVPTIILGPGSIEQAHKTPEFVELAQLEKAYYIYKKIIQHFLH